MKHGMVGEIGGREKTDGSAICSTEKRERNKKKKETLEMRKWGKMNGVGESAQFMIDTRC